MEDLKIRVKSEVESKEVQELFFELGYGFEGCKNKDVQFFEYVYPFYLFAYKDKDLTVSGSNSVFSLKTDHKEITLPKLRDLVVLKRNDKNDRTHVDSSWCDYYQDSHGDFYYKTISRWERTREIPECIKPIEKPMKEFLVNHDGKWTLQLLDSDTEENSYRVAVPEGENVAYMDNDNSEIYFTRIEMGYRDVELIWQRSEKESPKDQYAEIEKVREKTVSDTLKQRESTYGSFEDVASVTQDLLSVLKRTGLESLPKPHKEALHMICSKMARIVNGDFNYKDNWHDIGGYSKLIEDLLD